jgi:hypothetical protein
MRCQDSCELHPSLLKNTGLDMGDIQKPMNNSLMEYAATEQTTFMEKTVLPTRSYAAIL